MAKFIIKRSDGGISIGNMIEGTDLDQEVAKWAESNSCTSVYHQMEERFPDDKDEYFFEAYDHNEDGGVFVDMAKARVLHMNRLRQLRAEKFIAMGFPHRLHQGVEHSVLDEDTKAKLQALRDIPQKFDLSSVTDHNVLRNMIPDILK